MDMKTIDGLATEPALGQSHGPSVRFSRCCLIFALVSSWSNRVFGFRPDDHSLAILESHSRTWRLGNKRSQYIPQWSE